MKRSTILGCFVGLLSLTLSAQTTQPSNSKTSSSPTSYEVQKKSTASIQELLTRYGNVGKQAGAVSDHFSIEEQQMLRSYFNSQQSARSANTANTVIFNSSAEARNISFSPENRTANRQYTPLFVDFNNHDRESSLRLPAAYFNSTATTVSENAGVAATGQRNTSVTIPYTGTYYNNIAPNATLYDNGPFWNVAGSPNVSLLESTTLGMGTLGSGAQFSAGNSVADDVVFTEDVDITSIDVFAYQTGSTPPSVTGIYLQVWDGDPSGGSASVIWGDLVTNIFNSATYADANRASETTPGDTSRKIQRVKATTTGLSLTAGTYWIQYSLAGSGASGPWTPPIAILGQATTGNALQYQASISAWVALEDSGTFTPQGLPFVMYGEVTGGGGGFPDPYCGPLEFNSGVEPITLVDVAGISNVSDPTLDGSPAHEDFTAIVGNMEEGMTYAIALEGNTGGPFTTSFTVFIDWNQDGILDNASERYEIGAITGSTGTDGIQATGNIEVPAGVTPGPTRLRVIKRYTATYATDSCTPGSGYGQAEDYTIDVTAAGGGTFPEPYCGPLEFNSDVEPITLVDVAGISNVSDAAINGSPAHEDFTAIVGNMEEGMSYPIALEGNTGGGFTNSFTVFIDWNQDGLLDNASERYEIGTIQGSTGTDGIQATGNIVVPSGVTAGTTRMRVIKRFQATYATDSCTPGSGYGQAEDYTVDVTSGGGGTTACNQEHPVVGDASGGSGSSQDSDFKSAADIVVASGIDFTIDTIFVPFLTFAPEDAPVSATVVYYEDAAGLPGAQIGTETVVPTILSSSPWINPVAFEFKTQLDLTPFTFEGDASSNTTYWIEVSMGTATNQATVFWEYTDGAGLEGEPMAQYNALDGFWTVPEPTREVIYNFVGECTPMGGGGCTPDSLSTLYAAGNNGAAGGAVYFDITVADSDIDVLSFDLNTADLGAFTVGVYMFEGTYAGNEANPAMWGTADATGSGTGAGIGLPSTATLDAPISLSANTTYAVALVFDGTHSHYYTNGDGTNQNYSNGDLELNLGSASNTPFTTPIFAPRIFNGGVGYCVGGGGVEPGPLTTVYGINNGNIELIGFGVTTPGNTEVFGTSPVTVNFENAGAIDPANPTTGYVLDNGGQFFSFDVESGFYTLLGSIPGDWVGMEFDRTSGTLYAIAGATLYTIDPAAVSATLVGVMGIPAADLPIALAIDGDGVGYTYELTNNLLYSVDLATAATTAIGDIGFDANFGQGMCYDPTTDKVYMSAFNSGSFAAEWRSVDLTTGMTTLIGPIVTTAATTQVAWSSIGETLDPPTCPEPTNLAVSNITSTSVDLSWNVEPNASSGYIWYVFEAGDNPATDSPVATGTTPAGTTTATATGLSGGLSYDFYVVADCDSDGLSQFAGPVTFATPPACGGKFYDTGGPTGDYENNANVTTVISPDVTGEAVTVTFTSFNTETGWDALYVYDGPNASSPIISSGNPPTNSGFPAGGYYGTSIPGPFTSSHPSGALTFVFRSDASVTYPGWVSDVTCSPIGIGENVLEGFSFYPNPTNGMLSLRSADNIENVAFYNVLGQMVITQRVNATTSQVDVSALSTGTYLMKVTVNGQIGTYRVLKQ